MFRPLAAVLLLSAPLPALAQDAATGAPPQRVRSVTLTGTERCPPSTADEVVVCSRVAPGEQYRIPAPLRDSDPIPAQRQSWAARTATIDQVSRRAGGLPNTCSPVGSGGFTGCFNQYGQAFAAEKGARADAERTIPGGREYVPADDRPTEAEAAATDDAGE